jgi:chemotaxis protein methyltransferase CheR
VTKPVEDGPGEALFAEITGLVARRSGMVFATNRRVEAEAGIRRAMEQAGIPDAAAYLEGVRRDVGALDLLVDELTVGETHFMRDPAQMDQIRREILPDLRRRKAGAPVRVWSAGCATGEEAYSLAILLAEAGLDQGAFVLGTDLSRTALEKARRGSYSDWSMRGVSDSFLTDYFRHVRGRRVLVDGIRDKAHFERLNLVGPDEYATVGAARMDLILCRNVLIYFDHETAGRIARRLFDSLAEGGVLLTAGADLLLAEHAPFEVEVTRVGLVYRRPAPAPMAAPVSTVAAPVPPAPRDLDQPRPPPAPAAAPAEPDLAREAFDRVTRRANAQGAEEAERIARAALRRHPLDAHLHYLRATLLLALDRDEDAEQDARRALFLDRSLAVAHFLLGTILRKRGARADALKAFRNAQGLCAARPSDESLPAGAGERSGALHSAASVEVQRLEDTGV